MVPSPSANVTLLAATRTTLPPVELVACSNPKSPLSRWPSSRNVTPVPTTRRNGPPGTSSVSVWPLSTNSSDTAAGVELTTTSNVPMTPNWLASSPGIEMAIVPPMRPAMPPPGGRRKKPEPLVRLTIGSLPAEMVSVTSLAAMRTIRGGGVMAPGSCGRLTCSKAKLPVSDWPKSESVALVARTEMPGVTSRPPIVRTLVVELIRTSTSADRLAGRPGTLRAIEPWIEATTPVGPSSTAPLVIVTTTAPPPRFSSTSFMATDRVRRDRVLGDRELAFEPLPGDLDDRRVCRGADDDPLRARRRVDVDRHASLERDTGDAEQAHDCRCH